MSEAGLFEQSPGNWKLKADNPEERVRTSECGANVPASRLAYVAANMPKIRAQVPRREKQVLDGFLEGKHKK